MKAPAPKPINGLQYEFTTASAWEGLKPPRRPRVWAPALAGLFLAVLAMLVIYHDSRPLTDPRSPDLVIAEAFR